MREWSRKWCHANPEKVRARSRRHYEKHREAIKARHREKYAEDPQRNYRAWLKWKQANPEIAHANARKQYQAWVSRHPGLSAEQGRKRQQTRRARKKQVFVEEINPAVVFERAGGRCGVCKEPIDKTKPWHVDHIIPLAKGGVHSYGNVQPAHARCNLQKGAKLQAV